MEIVLGRVEAESEQWSVFSKHREPVICGVQEVAESERNVESSSRREQETDDGLAVEETCAQCFVS